MNEDTIAFDNRRRHPDMIDSQICELLIVPSVSGKDFVRAPECVSADPILPAVKLIETPKSIEVKTTCLDSRGSKLREHSAEIALHIPPVRVDPDHETYCVLAACRNYFLGRHLALLQPSGSMSKPSFQRPPKVTLRGDP